MLFRKFLRDLWKNKIQFISIFIMAALSSYIYAGMGSLYNGLDYEQDKYYRQTNFADYMVYKSDGFSEDDIADIRAINGVNSIDRRCVINDAIAFEHDNGVITLNIVESGYEISKCKVVKGESISASAEGVWLDDRYAKENNIKVGDSFGLSISGNKIQKKVKGLVINPEYIYQVNVDNIVPNHKDMGFAFMTYEAADELYKDMYNQLLIDMKKDKKLTEDKLEEVCKSYDIYQTREDISGHVMFNQAIEQYRAIGIIFPIAFLAVTILTMLTTITRLVDKQRVEIGTLGTLGLKKNKIYRHYISFGFFPAFLGCIVGVVSAPYTLPYTFYETLNSLYTMEHWIPRLPLNSWLIVILCIVLCVLVTYTTTRKVLKETPAQAIKPKVSKEIDNSKILQSEFAKNMNFSAKWNLIDMIKGKNRMFMTVIGIAGCIGLLIAGFGFRDSLNQVVITQYEKLYKFNSKLVLDVTKQDVIKNIEDKYKDVEYIYEGQVDIRKGDTRKLTNISVVNDIEQILYKNEENKSIKVSTDKINISRKLAKFLDVSKGDSIKVKLYGTKEYKDVTIGEIYVSPITQGIVISKDYYKQLGYEYIDNYALTSSKDVKKSDKEGIVKVITKSKLKADYEVTKKTLDSISLILMFSAILLAIVVLYNLNMLSLYEKQNEFALLKVMGFKSSRIRNLLLKQTIMLVIIGMILGIPFGIGLLKLILGTMGDSVDMSMKVSVLSYAISILVTCGLSIVMNLMFIVNIKNIDMVSSLKNIE